MERMSRLEETKQAVREHLIRWGEKLEKIGGCEVFATPDGGYHRFGEWGNRFVLEYAENRIHAEAGVYEDSVVIDDIPEMKERALAEILYFVTGDLPGFFTAYGYTHQFDGDRHLFVKGQRSFWLMEYSVEAFVMRDGDKPPYDALPSEWWNDVARAVIADSLGL